MRPSLCLAQPRCRGVTLIEVVIAIFVLSIGIVGIISLFPAGYRLTRRAVERNIAGLAARQALARVYGRINIIKASGTDPASEPLAELSEFRRVGIVTGVSTNTLTCKVLGNQAPGWTVSFADYYLVMASGSAEGHVYKIKTSGSDTIETYATFNTGTEKQYEPVRVGDYFAIIGNKTGTKCFPTPFLEGNITYPPSQPENPENNETCTMPVATYGDPSTPKGQWRYSYGCIISAPPPESRDTCRLDVFVYSGYPALQSGMVPADGNPLVVGHYVAYVAAGRAP